MNALHHVLLLSTTLPSLALRTNLIQLHPQLFIPGLSLYAIPKPPPPHEAFNLVDYLTTPLHLTLTLTTSLPSLDHFPLLQPILSCLDFPLSFVPFILHSIRLLSPFTHPALNRFNYFSYSALSNQRRSICISVSSRKGIPNKRSRMYIYAYSRRSW